MHFSYFPIKGVAIRISFTKGCFVPSFVEIGLHKNKIFSINLSGFIFCLLAIIFFQWEVQKLSIHFIQVGFMLFAWNWKLSSEEDV